MTATPHWCPSVLRKTSFFFKCRLVFSSLDFSTSGGVWCEFGDIGVLCAFVALLVFSRFLGQGWCEDGGKRLSMSPLFGALRVSRALLG